MGIEKIVRAYQLPQNSPPRRELRAGQVDQANVRLEVGKDGGGGKTMEGNLNTTTTYYCDAADVEIFQ